MADQPSPEKQKTMAEQQANNIPFGRGVSDVIKLMNGISHGDKEVFLRDLVLYATQALYKMRREILYESYLIGPRGPFIDIIPDKCNNTLSIVDNGIGMTQDDLNKLFTDVAFVDKTIYNKSARLLKNNQVAVDQFYMVAVDQSYTVHSHHLSLGFFAAFMVADKVEITTKNYGGFYGGVDEPPCKLSASVRDMSFCIVGVGGDHSSTQRGTKVTLHLNKDQFEYLDVGRLKALIDKYTYDLVPYPISICSPSGDIVEQREEKKKDMDELKREFEDFRKLFEKAFKHAVISDRLYDRDVVVSLDMSTIEINPRHWYIKQLRQHHMNNGKNEDLLQKICGLNVRGKAMIALYVSKHNTSHCAGRGQAR